MHAKIERGLSLNRTSRCQDALTSSRGKSQSLVTSAATIQGALREFLALCPVSNDKSIVREYLLTMLNVLSAKARLGSVILAFTLLAAAQAVDQGDQKSTHQGESIIEVRGKIVCLLEEMHERYKAELPSPHAHLYALKTAKGEYYTLMRGKISEGIFADSRMRAKEFIIRGRTFSGTKLLEPMRLSTVRDGTVHDIFYYCSICAIETMNPGECVCCREPVELTEKPRLGTGGK
jgi:hypothetical protein